MDHGLEQPFSYAKTHRWMFVVWFIVTIQRSFIHSTQSLLWVWFLTWISIKLQWIMLMNIRNGPGVIHLCVLAFAVCVPPHIWRNVGQKEIECSVHCAHVEMIRDGYILVFAHHFYQRINNCWQNTWEIKTCKNESHLNHLLVYIWSSICYICHPCAGWLRSPVMASQCSIYVSKSAWLHDPETVQ